MTKDEERAEGRKGIERELKRGSLELIVLACLIGLPIGVGAGIYLAEVGGQGRLAKLVRFTADVLGGVPSITVGVFVYAFVVVTMRRFSAIASMAPSARQSTFWRSSPPCSALPLRSALARSRSIPA